MLRLFIVKNELFLYDVYVSVFVFSLNFYNSFHFFRLTIFHFITTNIVCRYSCFNKVSLNKCYKPKKEIIEIKNQTNNIQFFPSLRPLLFESSEIGSILLMILAANKKENRNLYVCNKRNSFNFNSSQL